MNSSHLNITCRQKRCSFPVYECIENTNGYCQDCFDVYEVNDNNNICSLCECATSYLDSPLCYVRDVPLSWMKCNHWACEECWVRRFSHRIFTCHECDVDVFRVMNMAYDTLGTRPFFESDEVDCSCKSLDIPK
jgi:hypothetical protein